MGEQGPMGHPGVQRIVEAFTLAVEKEIGEDPHALIMAAMEIAAMVVAGAPDDEALEECLEILNHRSAGYKAPRGADGEGGNRDD